MNNSKKSIHFLHYPRLASTNQKLYQLAEHDVGDWTVVYCDEQNQGKGYSGNKWQSEAYKNALFSFILKDAFHLEKDLPYLNMWIAVSVVEFLSNWQIPCQVKWPNDIILNNKKLAGILIENKIQGVHSKFTVVGIGLNILQTEFMDLPNATSLKKEFPEKSFNVEEFIKTLMYFLQNQYDQISQKGYSNIHKEYNNLLFKRNQVAVYTFDNQKHNGILKEVNKNGNAVIELEPLGTKVFKHKEIGLLY